MPIRRREMLVGTAALLGAARSGEVFADQSEQKSPDSVTEPPRQTPIVGSAMFWFAAVGRPV